MGSMRRAVQVVVCLMTVGSLVELGSLPARAEDACKNDVSKFCQDVPLGGGRVVACLSSHEKELSDPCRTEMSATQAKLREIRSECADDIHRFCAQVQPGAGRVLDCLRTQQNQLSIECQAIIQQGLETRDDWRKAQDEKKNEIRSACDVELKRFCESSGVDGQVGCLKSHQPDLSQVCSAALPK